MFATIITTPACPLVFLYENVQGLATLESLEQSLGIAVQHFVNTLVIKSLYFEEGNTQSVFNRF